MILFSAAALAAQLPGDADLTAIAEAAVRVRIQGRSAAPFELESDVVRWGGGARVRVTPVIDGLRVEGSTQVVALSATGEEQRVTGPAVDLSPPQWGGLGREQAIELAEQGMHAFGMGRLWQPRATETLLRVDDGVRHAWAVDLGVVAPLATWRVWIDAVDGSVLSFDRTSHEARGRVYDPSPVAGPPVDVELFGLDDPAALSGRYADAYSCTEWTISDSVFGINTCDRLERRAAPANGDYLYEPVPGEPDDPFTEVNLYHHVSVVGRYFEQRFGLRRNLPFTTIANFEMQNAFFGDFDGDGIADLAFGFSDGTQFGYDAEVVYHEYGHWVVARLADIPSLRADPVGLDWIGGSINEGAADVFSMLLEPDPDLGEYAGLGFRDGPIRQLAEDRTCPGNLEGEVHVDGELIGSLGWNLIEELGTGITGDLMIGAVSSWGRDIDWTLAGQSFIDAANDLQAAGAITAAQTTFVVAQVEASGMLGCPRVIPLDSGNTQRAFVLSGGLQGDLYRLPGQNQYSIAVPDDAERLVIELGEFTGGEGLVWSVFVRAGQPIHNEPSNLGNLGLGFATPVAWDWLADGSQAYDRLVIDAASDPPLVPGETYYIAVAGRTDGTIELFDFTRGRLAIRAGFEVQEESRGTCSTAPTKFPGLPLFLGRRR